jgi:hypothetical protein
MTTLEYFDLYTDFGLQVIPLFPGSKIPVWSRWNQDWDHARCRSYIKAQPACNIGLLLGKYVDVEGDTEEADEEIKRLIGECPHPSWRSAKSTHHLFLNPDPRLTSTRFSGMEFRAHKHQSVIPPSIHAQGVKYHWQSLHVIPAMPQALFNYYLASRRKKKRHSGYMLTECKSCGGKESIHVKRLLLEVRAFRELGLLWQCHKCRKVDVRPACRRLRSLLRTVPPVLVAQPPRKKYGGLHNILGG